MKTEVENKMGDFVGVDINNNADNFKEKVFFFSICLDSGEVDESSLTDYMRDILTHEYRSVIKKFLIRLIKQFVFFIIDV